MRRWFEVYSTRFMSFFISGFLSFITVVLLFLLISPCVLAADENILIPTSGNKISSAKPDISGELPLPQGFHLSPSLLLSTILHRRHILWEHLWEQHWEYQREHPILPQ